MGLRPVDFVMGVGVALTWGMGVVFAKAAIAHFPPILLMTFRFAITALALVWFVRPPVHQFKRIFGIAIISAAIQYSLTFNGLRGVDASVAGIMLQLEVPFLVLLGWLVLKERPGIRKWLGIGIAFIGVGFIAGQPKIGGAWISLLLLVGGSVTWAIGQVLVRKLETIDGLTLTAWVAVFATPQLAVMSLALESNHLEAIATANWVVWGAAIYLGLIMTALGYYCWYSLVRRHPVGMVAPFLLLLPVFSVIGGITFLGERLSLLTALGGAIVISGVAVILLERAPEVEKAEAVRLDPSKN